MEIKGNEPLVLSVEEARRMLGVSRGLMYGAIRRGEINHLRVGNRILIPKAPFLRWLERDWQRGDGHAGEATGPPESEGNSQKGGSYGHPLPKAQPKSEELRP
jgi:excisionase family DNA binding protein